MYKKNIDSLKKKAIPKINFFFNFTNRTFYVTYILSNRLIIYLPKDDLPTLPPPHITDILGVKYSIYKYINIKLYINMKKRFVNNKSLYLRIYE